jgi:SAM-dependent methyltransferase
VTGGFGPYNGRDNATSPGIGKLERLRLFCLLAPSLFNEILSKRMAHSQPYDSKADHLDFKGQASLVPLRVLVFAPQGEQATLRVALEAAAQHGHFPVDFVPADIDGEQVRSIVGRAGLGMNAEEIAFPDKFFDAVIFSHVLKHVTDMRPALAEIGRVLNDDGFAVLSAPIYQEDTFEDRDFVTEECRLEKFGQKDHVRRVGWDVLGIIKEHFADVRKGQTTDLMNVKFGELLPWFKNPELSQNSRDVYLYPFKSVPSTAVTRVFD